MFTQLQVALSRRSHVGAAKEVPMAGDSEYAQRQFREQQAAHAKSEQVERELRSLRHKVRWLEQQVSSLVTELSQRRVIGESRRGHS